MAVDTDAAGTRCAGSGLLDYALVSNSTPRKRDPLTLAISMDGLVYTQLLWLIGGRHVDYPQIIEHDGHLLIAFFLYQAADGSHESVAGQTEPSGDVGFSCRQSR